MRILVTGGKGFIGTNMVRSLQKMGEEVVVFDLSDGYDVCNFEQLNSFRDIDCIIHLASKIFVPESFTNPRDFFSVNILGILNCLEYCRINNSKLIYLSSYLYGEPNYLPVDEKHPVCAFNPYSASKIECENLCNHYYQYFKTRSILFRPFNVYGNGQSDKFLIPKMIQQAKSGKIHLIDPHPRRDFVFVEDLVDCVLAAVKDESLLHDTINIASRQSFSVDEVARMVAQLSGTNIEITYENVERIGEVSDTCGSNVKAGQLLGWSPKTTLFEGLSKMIQSTINQ